jgi:toxin ParE1/3/4
MTGYGFHPEAEADLNEIWDYIAEENAAAADRLIAEIEHALDRIVLFPREGRRRPDLDVARFASCVCASI